MGFKPNFERALVTGAGGFLGSEIARQLCKAGVKVRGFSRHHHMVLDSLPVEIFLGDLLDLPSLERAISGCEIVFHTAAKVGLWGPEKDFEQVNVQGTRNVIEACRLQGVRRLVFTSSPSVIFNGQDMNGPNESLPYPSHYESPYPKTKAAAEKNILGAADENLATVALRPHLIWGPNDPHLVKAVLERGKSRALRRIGSENKKVDFTFVQDAARAHLLAAQELRPGSILSGKAYFISQGEPWFLWDFVDAILESAGLPPSKGQIPKRAALMVAFAAENFYRIFRPASQPPLTRFIVKELTTAHWFDISAATKDFGYWPQHTMSEALKKLSGRNP